MRFLFIAVALFALTQPTRADKLILVAGGGDLGDGHDATKAKLIQPFGVDFYPDGDDPDRRDGQGRATAGDHRRRETPDARGKDGE